MEGLLALAKVKFVKLLEKSCSLEQYEMLEIYSMTKILGCLPHRIRRHFYRVAHRNSLEYYYFLHLSGKRAAKLLSIGDYLNASVSRIFYLSISFFSLLLSESHHPTSLHLFPINFEIIVSFL